MERRVEKARLRERGDRDVRDRDPGRDRGYDRPERQDRQDRQDRPRPSKNIGFLAHLSLIGELIV